MKDWQFWFIMTILVSIWSDVQSNTNIGSFIGLLALPSLILAVISAWSDKPKE